MFASVFTTKQGVIQSSRARPSSRFLKMQTPRSTTIHILHDNTLTLDSREKFSYVAGQYNQAVKFYNVEELCAEKIKEFWRRIPSIETAWVTIGGFFRLLIPYVLPDDIEKAVYLDSDIIVNLDINELWRMELDDKPLAAVPEHKASPVSFDSFVPQNYTINAKPVEYEDYFNSGVLLMNLEYLRGIEDKIMNGVKWYGEHEKECIAFDQDILNYLFSKTYLKLPPKFNKFIFHARNVENAKKIKRVIYHYTHPLLKLDLNDTFNRFWMKYFIRTPWFNEETIEHLYAGTQGLHVELKNFAVQVSAMMSGKTRAFFTLPQNVDATKKIFSIRDDEEIILADNSNALQKLIDAMKLSKGKKIFFILTPGFPFQILIQAGFVYGRDFFNGMEFLSEAHGVPFDSYPLVKAM